MCFGNHKYKGITNVWPLLVAIKTINLFILMALQKPSSFHLAFKFLFFTLTTTNLFLGLFGQPSVIDHLHIRSERAMREL